MQIAREVAGTEISATGHPRVSFTLGAMAGLLDSLLDGSSAVDDIPAALEKLRGIMGDPEAADVLVQFAAGVERAWAKAETDG
jgi:hypothetical protein